MSIQPALSVGPSPPPPTKKTKRSHKYGTQQRPRPRRYPGRTTNNRKKTWGKKQTDGAGVNKS